MKKFDLRTGHIVTTRDGYQYMVFLNAMAGMTGGMDVLVRDGGFTYLCNYDDDLRNDSDYRFDIIKVEAVTGPLDFGKSVNNVRTARTLWERTDPKKKMTVAEIEKILGYGVEIVSEG